MEKRIDDYIRRIEKLRDLAEKDPIYCAWEEDYKECKEKMERLEKWLPKSWRKTLDIYMRSREMMLQRMISLGCMCMEFTGEEPLWYKKAKEKRVIKFENKK